MHTVIQTFVIAVVVLFCNVGNATGKAAFIVIDVQDCFLPAGSLPITNGDVIPPVINSIRDKNKFDMVAFSLDWHLPGHVSFASTHQKPPGESVQLKYTENGVLCLGGTITPARFPKAENCNGRTTKLVEQKLWPDHCLQNVSTGSQSSKLAAALKRENGDVIVYKGTKKEIDSYSAFYDNGNFFSTDLDNILKAEKINKVFIAGFALDICVYYTSMDAKKLGYDTYTVVDASLGVDPAHIIEAEQKLRENGINLIQSKDIPSALEGRPFLFYKNVCNRGLKALDMNMTDWEEFAKNRSSWKQNHASKTFGPCLTLVLLVSIMSRKLASNLILN